MQERRIHQIFEVSVLLKGAHAALEVIGGLALALTANAWITSLITPATQSELIEDRPDFVANHLVFWAQGFSIETQHFCAWYLLSHGVVKLALVVGLLMRKLWAYPTTMVVLGLFILYQLYRYTETHGVGCREIAISSHAQGRNLSSANGRNGSKAATRRRSATGRFGPVRLALIAAIAACIGQPHQRTFIQLRS